ncbi:MAG TPA: hypothetical protein VG389_10430 [Myxococcota bacterium]|jgi:hypothetical protein|nr:hypothetical protein [Myxococcota bacterium]
MSAAARGRGRRPRSATALVLFAGVVAASVLGAGLRDATASSALRLEVADLARASEVVIVGRVEATRAEWNSAGTGIHTLVTVRVAEVVARTEGTPSAALVPGQTVEVLTRGGVVGDMGMTVLGAAELRTGEEVVLFLERLGPRLGAVGWAQGKWALAPVPPPAAPGAPPATLAPDDRLCVSAAGAFSLMARGPDGALVPVPPPGARTLRTLKAEVRAARGAR